MFTYELIAPRKSDNTIEKIVYSLKRNSKIDRKKLSILEPVKTILFTENISNFLYK